MRSWRVVLDWLTGDKVLKAQTRPAQLVQHLPQNSRSFVTVRRRGAETELVGHGYQKTQKRDGKTKKKRGAQTQAPQLRDMMN